MANKLPQEELLAQKLDTLIRLQARIAVAHLSTQKERVLFLNSAGLAPKEIGDILGVSANSVSVTLLAVRKAEKSKRGKEGELQRD
jgi:DNA-binding CsgD family transcriptional regulator